jgi:SAM-dependent methyltransferase
MTIDPLNYYQLDLIPGQGLLNCQSLPSSQNVALTIDDGYRIGFPLYLGTEIYFPPVFIDYEFVLCTSFSGESCNQNPCKINLSYSLPDAPQKWFFLAEFSLGAPSKPQYSSELKIFLSMLQGEIIQIRLVRLDQHSSKCFLTGFKVCADHAIGKVNALSNYDFRLENEIKHFSSGVYSHKIYGEDSNNYRSKMALETVKLVPTILHREDFTNSITSEAYKSLLSIHPHSDEIAYSYAIRALGQLLPMTPPNFFERAKNLSKTNGLKILSLCSGAARIEEQILSFCTQSVSLTLLDASLDLAQKAKARLSSTNKAHNVQCLVGDINEGLPGDDLYDLIICVSAMHHVANLELVLSQVNNRLSNKGEFWSIGEQIGRNGNRLWPEAYEAANIAFKKLPSHLRFNNITKKIDTYISDRDFSISCFEGIRSQEIESLFESYFIPVDIYKRNAFLWRLIDPIYSDNFDIRKHDDLNFLRELVCLEVAHWVNGGRSTELHGIYRKKQVNN